MTNVTVTASGATDYSYGMYNASSSPTIEHSKLKGSTHSIYNSLGSVKVANSQLDGHLHSSTGSMVCLDNYNANFAAVTCP